MRSFTVAAVLAALPIAFGQFAPPATASAALGPAPTESIGCRVVNGAWSCAAARDPAPGAASTATGTPTVAASTRAANGLYPPAESTGCVAHGDHFHCEGPAEGSAATPTTAAPSVPSPTESGHCMWHISHWDCFDSAAELQAAQTAGEASESGEGGECIIHVGHTHGDCSASDLACGAILLEDYNMGLHVAAVFIILVTSGLGVLLPIISAWFRRRREPSDSDSERTVRGDASADFGRKTGLWGNVFFIARHFGTGIILSTAFIHLLFHGFVMFQNECVGHMSYEATAPAISLAAAMITFLFDFIGGRFAARQHQAHHARSHSGDRSEKNASPESPGSEHSHHHVHPHTIEDPHGHHIDAAFAAEQNWQVLLLEAGIIFHSIMIGVTLGAGSGNGWTTLFIVIIFHQIFEGLALGARIAVLSWITRTRALIMAGAFTLITPIGIAIGIAVRKSFSQNGKASLLSVGILNAISAGILLYTAFKLLAADFTDGPLRQAKIGKVLVAMSSLLIGVIAMAILGKWA